MVLLDYEKIMSVIPRHIYHVFIPNDPLLYKLSHLSKMQREYILVCVEQACRSNMRFQHGCVAVHNKRIIATSFNYDYGNAKMIHGHSSVHAEIGALFKCKEQNIPMEEIELYVVRIHEYKEKVTKLKDSKPCKNCRRMCEKHGISRVYYSVNC